jgi:hypothetical protein
LVSSATAAVFDVTGTADGTGSCTGSGPSSCPSLRSAIIASNSAGGSNTINVPAGTYTLSIGPTPPDNATTGDLNISADVTISGAGSGTAGTTIVGNGDRIFDITATNATLSGMSITGGSQQQDGGAIRDQGSSLAISNDVVTNNTTSSLGSGGGLFMRPSGSGSATLTITNSSFTSNIAADTSTSGGGFGGAIDFEPTLGGTMTVTNSTFASNTAQGGSLSQGGFGGGISFEPSGTASLTVTNSTFASNTAGSGATSGGGFGGGISFEPSGTSTLTVTGSTFSSNTAAGSTSQGGFGGGIDYEPAGGGDVLSVTNSTFFGNTAGGLSGFGGAMDYEPTTGDTATLTNVTIVGNSVNRTNQGGGLDIEAPMTIRNSIVSGNTAGSTVNNCAVFGPTDLAVGGHNIEQGTTCVGFDINANPLLGPLANNGGPTQTMALLAGSPAIDAGLPTFCPATDQRGIARPDQPGTACDIGAYEFVVPQTPPPPPPPPPTTKPEPPHGTQIYKRKFEEKKHSAKFWFRAAGTVKGFQCELRPYVEKKHRYRDGKWRPCSSPSSYAHLKRGRYLFEVRGYNTSGPDKKPAITTFRI